MPAFDLVIFDCDGVLVDSERITNGVFAEMLGEIGLRVTLDEMFERFLGLSMAACLNIITTLRGSPVPEGFVEEYRERTTRALRERLVPIEGARQAVEMLAAPYCVASSGSHDKMRTTLGITDLLDIFEGKLFSATEVSRGKPFPDVYLHAAECMGANPRRCAVVEDSPVGVEAGFAAGMTVFGYSKRMTGERLSAAGASVTFDDMRKLPHLLHRPSTHRQPSRT
jgi:HAD superfamily hydrolase (TIGR01509 family)